jgi:hypothetical protein
VQKHKILEQRDEDCAKRRLDRRPLPSFQRNATHQDGRDDVDRQTREQVCDSKTELGGGRNARHAAAHAKQGHRDDGRLPDPKAGRSSGGTVGADQEQLPSEARSLQDEPRHQGQDDEGPALRRNAERASGSEPLRRLGAKQDVLVVADERGDTAKQRAECERRDDRVPTQRNDAALNRTAPRGENEGGDQADGQSVVVSHQERENARRKDRKFLGGQRKEIAGNRDVGHPDRYDAGDRRGANHHQQILKRQKARRGESANHQQRDNPYTDEQECEPAARGRLRLCRRSAGRRKAPEQTGDHAASLPAARFSG